MIIDWWREQVAIFHSQKFDNLLAFLIGNAIGFTFWYRPVWCVWMIVILTVIQLHYSLKEG